ncbi:MAG: phosphodiester glycosidase family protein [Clostridiales bacterium]|jgi:exopolysaccharide biosynthesis protein|nr:phosphodiester glycosidase family protein [Eubacteriales bacterium]MDH7567704.1 phosphodiester glycosidase family protein [Clostridiales bacterium]
MKYIRKGLAVTLISVFFAVLALNTGEAYAYTLYETSTKQTVTSGATLENIVRFTDSGWVNIYVLRVDLTNPYINVDTMINQDSVKKLSPVKTLAQERGAVAAINGGFFNWLKEAGSGYPDGPVVESGKIITADNEYNRYNDSMATFAINNLNQALFSYWKTDISLAAPNGNSTVVMHYNKTSKDYCDFTVLDRRWGDTSIGADAERPDLAEMLVVDGKVKEIRQGQPAFSIPENGYVVVTRQAGYQFLTDNFKVGDQVSLNIATNPDWKTVKMAVTGSAILVKDGQIPAAFSMNISGRQPRTAVGSSQDGKQLIIVTVDGRQNSSIGMTQDELARFMIDCGAYNAVNLDGGGSTTMVARTPGTSEINVVNSPSDGYPRSISTAVGVFSTAPASELNGLLIGTEDRNVFVNTSRSFTVKGVDKYFNPAAVDPASVTWSVSGVEGYFKGSTFYPTSVGEGKVKASVGDISSEFDISVLSAPVQLDINKKSVKLPVGGSQDFYVTGKNKDGFSAAINPGDVHWSAVGGMGSMDGNVFTAAKTGTGYVDGAVGDAHAYCAVSIGGDTSVLKDGFETVNGSFTSYPATVPGSYGISTEQKHSGKSSGKLTYDFTNTEGTRAAYMVFADGGMPIAGNTVRLGLWVYNSHANANWLRAEVKDSGGKKHLVDFTRNLDWTGWKYVEASLEGIDSPSAVTRLYLAQPSPVADSGSIYLDDLSAVTSTYPAVDMGSIPKATQVVDSDYKSIVYKPSEDSFRFSVFGQARDPQNPVEEMLTKKLAEKINAYIEVGAFVGSNRHEVTGLVKKPVVSANQGYKSFDIKNSRFIQLDVDSKGIRSVDPAQWNWFRDQLNTAAGDHVFIFMENSHKAFGDSLESNLFQDVLTEFKQKTGKNVWVFYKGDTNASYMEKGIKYISTAGYDVQGLTGSNTDIVKYVLVTVKGDTVTYEFKPII